MSEAGALAPEGRRGVANGGRWRRLSRQGVDREQLRHPGDATGDWPWRCGHFLTVDGSERGAYARPHVRLGV